MKRHFFNEQKRPFPLLVFSARLLRVWCILNVGALQSNHAYYILQAHPKPLRDVFLSQ